MNSVLENLIQVQESLKASVLPNNGGFLKKILFFEMVMIVIVTGADTTFILLTPL